MFDIGTKIKHAWKTIWDYKSLWFFVFIMTLTGAGGVSSGGGSGGNTYSSKTKDLFNNGGLGAGTQLPAWMNEIKTWVETNVVPLFSTPEKIITTILWIIAAIFLLAVILSTLMALLRYPSETAVIRMVNDYEQTGTKIKFKAGWGLGWNQRALRLWMIDLVLSLPGIFFAFMVVLTGILVLSRYINGDQNALLASSIVLICVALIFFLVFGLIGVFLGLLRHFVARAAVLDGTNVRESFKRGWQMLTHNFKNIFLTWLVMLGIGIGFGFVVLIGAIILIPAYLILAIPGALVGAIPAAVGYGISSSFASSPLTWIIAGLVFVPFFFTIVFSPLSLMNSWYLLFQSSIWTQTYREVNGVRIPPAIPMPEKPPALVM